jgi:hypothetical protein
MTPSSDQTPTQDVTPEELLEEIRKIRVADFVLSAVATLGQLAYSKLEPSTRDLDQARLAIEAVKALVPTLEGAVPAQTASDYGQLVANLQLAYVAAQKEAPQADAEPEPEAAPED